MNRRTAIRRLATFFLTTASLAEAQQPKKVPRIGYLSTSDAAIDSPRAEGIRLALRERGYIEGQLVGCNSREAYCTEQVRDDKLNSMVGYGVAPNPPYKADRVIE